ncbi:MAG: GtrA family protein, partial [Coriobacteriia bacterium]|nr:GtrA family protein [Coriobacteriia bacterium]
RLLPLVRDVSAAGMKCLVVDDASTAGTQVYDDVADLPGVRVLHLPTNEGMGGSLKTAIAYLAAEDCAGTPAVITAYAARGHTVQMIQQVRDALLRNPGCLVLGARDLRTLPGRHRVGNLMTRQLTKMLYGIEVADTQSSLRGFALTKPAELLRLRGEGYDYAMSMLLKSGDLFEDVVEVPIDVPREASLNSGHFRVVRDSVSIYRILLRHFPKSMAASVSSYAIDYVVFTLLFLFADLWVVWAAVGARVVSASVNYAINRFLVFGGQGRRYTPLRFFALAAVILCLNALFMFLLVDLAGLPALPVKVLVDLGLYFVNFAVQTNLAKA